jgi:hypothetical protein
MYPFLAWNMVTFRSSRGVLCSVGRRIQQMGTISAEKLNIYIYIYMMEMCIYISYIDDHSGLAVLGVKYLRRSEVGIVVSDPTQGTDVCVHLFCFCCPVCR